MIKLNLYLRGKTMKTNNLNLLLMLLLLMTGCYEDKGNYDYTPGEIVAISGIEESYTRLLFQENLKITPTITASDPNADLEYSWSYYDATLLPLQEHKITDTKDLDFKIPERAAKHVLIFRVTNKKTGYMQSAVADFYVNSYYSEGWYVAKNIDNKTDIDVFKSPEDYVYNTLLLANGKQLDGKAVKMSVADKYTAWDPVTNKAENITTAMALLSDRDIWMVNTTSMRIIRDVKTLFREEPLIKAPGIGLNNGTSLFIVNNGRIHDLNYMSLNDGRYSVPKWIDDQNSDYRLSKYAISNGGASKLLLFDEISSSFLCVGYDNLLIRLVDAKENDITVSDNNMILVYMGIFKAGVYYAVLQDKDSGERILIEIKTSSWSTEVFIKTMQRIKADDRAMKANRFTLSMGEPVLYFVAEDGTLWSYDISSGMEMPQFTTPEGERITLTYSIGNMLMIMWS